MGSTHASIGFKWLESDKARRDSGNENEKSLSPKLLSSLLLSGSFLPDALRSSSSLDLGRRAFSEKRYFSL
ncbi:MAG: hypothetical protein NZ611_08010, partial [Bacteroidia bacterium]|nr:hypothetical protein [Bacteroidia bacterium]